MTTNYANRLSLAKALIADATLCERAKVDLAAELAAAPKGAIRVFHEAYDVPGRVWLHIAGNYRRQELGVSAKWRSQLRRLGAVILC